MRHHSSSTQRVDDAGKASSEAVRSPVLSGGESRTAVLAGLAVLAVAILAFAACALSPLLDTGFIGDDLPNSYYVRAGYEVRGTTLATDIVSTVRGWWNNGRFYPLSTYVLGLFYFVDRDAGLYKALLLALNLMCLGLFGLVVRRATGSRTLGLLVLLITPLLFQFRPFEDPIVSYAGLVQVALLLSLLSFLALMRFIDSGTRRHLMLSLLAYGCALLTYEVVLPYFLIAFAIAWLYPSRKSARETLGIAWPFAGLAVVDAGLVLLLRQFVASPPPGADSAAYVPNFEVAALVGTYLKQTSAALPLVYRLGPGQALLASVTTDMLANLPAAAAFFLAGLVLATVVLGRVPKGERSADSSVRPGLGVLLGTGLFALSGALVVLSPRYQGALIWGLGYLPVYLSYFGLALVLAVAAWTLLRRVHAPVPRAVLMAVLAALIAGAGTVNYFDNRVVAEYQNTVWVYPIQLAERAAEAGLYELVPDGATLYSSFEDGRFEPAGFYALTAGARVALSSRPEPALRGDAEGWQGEPVASVFYTTRQATAPDEGYVLVGRIVDRASSEDEVTEVLLDHVRVYVAKPGLSAGAALSSDALSALIERGLDAARMRVVASGDGWALLESDPGYRAAVRPR